MSEPTTHSRDIGSRVDLVERDVKALGSAIRELSITVKDGFAAMRVEVDQRARPFPMREVLVSSATVVALITAMVTLANFWFDAKVSPVANAVRQVERSTDPGELAVMKYRMSQLEGAVKALPSR